MTRAPRSGDDGASGGGDGEFEVVSRRPTHRARKFRCEEERVRLPDGREVSREVIRHGGAALLLPVLPDGGIVLVRVFRHAAGGWLWEVPAGTIEPGEAPEACAARELEEETGYRAARLVPMGSWLPSPGLMDESMHLYRAEGLEATAARPEEDELVEPRAFAPDEVAAMVRRGAIRDGKTLLALFLGGVVAVVPGVVPAAEAR
jgi:ADP-ribose pyrophosphatase